MAVIFADSFDPYSSITDLTAQQWVTGSGATITSSVTPFGVGQSLTFSVNACAAPFTSATNETTVYGSVRVNAGSGSSAQYGSLTFTDGGTSQCTIRWNGDGSIGLYSGGPTGTLIQTYASIFTAGTWNSYQFKIVINNTTGSIEIRVNGATTNTITKTGVNTRAGTTNAYVNGFSVIKVSITYNIDDLLLNNTSGNAPTSWPGDMRAIQQVPVADTAKNFDVFPASITWATLSAAQTPTVAANTLTIGGSGLLSVTTVGVATTGIVTLNANLTGHLQVAWYDSTRTTPVIISDVLTNPVAGNNTLTYSGSQLLPIGSYYPAILTDASTQLKSGTSPTASYIASRTFASGFPTAPSLTQTGPTTMVSFTTVTVVPYNVSGVQELTQDGETSYVYTSTVEEDKYTMTAIPAGYSVTAVQHYVMWRKADAGARTVQLSVAANGSADTALITNSTLQTDYVYQFNIAENDPTGASWTPSTVNAAVTGLAVTA